MKRSKGRADSLSPVQDGCLPEFWVARKSKSRGGKTYYFNTFTGLSSWRHPGKFGVDQDLVGSRRRKSSESSGKTSLNDLSPVTKKNKGGKNWGEELSEASHQSTDRKIPSGRTMSTPNSSKAGKNTSKAGQQYTGADPELGSPTRARIANWVSSVSQSYEPTEQGSLVSGHSSNADFELPDCVTDVIIQPKRKTGGKARNLNKQKPVSCEKQGEKKKARESVPHLQIPKLLWKDEPQRGPTPDPLTPFSPVSTEPPPVVGTHPRRAPNTLSCAPVVPSHSHVVNLPMAVDAGGPLQAVEPSFPGTSRSSAHTTPPEACTATPVSPENAGHLGTNNHKANGGIAGNEFPVGGYPQDAAGTVNTARSQTGPVNSIDGAVGWPGDRSCSEDCEISMDIDDEELEAQIRSELLEIRASIRIDPAQIHAQAGDNVQHSYLDTLYIILDTNVLLSHLKFITELRDYPIQGSIRPTLIVPWIVMQELDSLKSDAWKLRRGKIDTSQFKKGQQGVDMLARKAIRFLHFCLGENHPRLRGQTLDEVMELMNAFPEGSNDDQILHCCLLFQRKAENGMAVLFSNDQNLCSKALINGVKAFNHQTLTNGLASMFPNSAVALSRNSFKEYNDELALQRKLAEKRTKADDIICELQCVLREGLSVVVEAEMRAAYDDLWEQIIYIKPPWTLKDLLQLLDKHWIAVFGLVLKRSVKEVVVELKKSFAVETGNPGCLANSSKILEQARQLFDAFAARSSYNEAITKCLAAVLVLQRKCQQFQGVAPFAAAPVPQHRTPAALGPPATPSCHDGISHSGGSDEHVDVASVSSADINTASSARQPHGAVLSTFEMIWSAVRQFSDQIFAGLEYQPSSRLLPGDVPKPTPQQAVQFLGRLCPCLACLVAALQNVLKLPAESAVQDMEPFDQLVCAVARFLEEILSTQSKVVVGDLFRFWQDKATRTSLIQGLSQLDRALAMLQHCASLVATS